MTILCLVAYAQKIQVKRVYDPVMVMLPLQHETIRNPLYTIHIDRGGHNCQPRMPLIPHKCV
jgi:hypothetical protein